MRIPIAICTCPDPKYRERRQLILDTWLPLVDRDKYDPFFYSGNRIDAESGDVPYVTLDCSDDYNRLAEKTRYMIAQALRSKEWDHLIKVDEDVYLPKRWLDRFEVPEGLHYGGMHEHGGPPRHFISSYVLSREFSEKLIIGLQTRSGPWEDESVARVFAESNMGDPVNLSRLRLRYGLIQQRPEHILREHEYFKRQP